MGTSGYLLDQPLNDRTHDIGFLQANFQDFPMVDSRLGWVVDNLSLELNEAPKDGKQNFLKIPGNM